MYSLKIGWVRAKNIYIFGYLSIFGQNHDFLWVFLLYLNFRNFLTWSTVLKPIYLSRRFFWDKWCELKNIHIFFITGSLFTNTQFWSAIKLKILKFSFWFLFTGPFDHIIHPRVSFFINFFSFHTPWWPYNNMVIF